MPETQPVSFSRTMDFVLSWEGGYVNHPDDPGGETKWGISKRAHPLSDIKNLTREGALAIYHADYWEPMDGDRLPEPVDLAAIDYAVHSGVVVAKEAAARLRRDPPDLWARRLTYYRMDHLIRLARRPRYRTFLRGWMLRCVALLREIDRIH